MSVTSGLIVLSFLFWFTVAAWLLPSTVGHWKSVWDGALLVAGLLATLLLILKVATSKPGRGRQRHYL